MAETVVVTETKTQKRSAARTIFWVVLITLVVIALIYLLMHLHRKMFSVNMTTINTAIAALVASPPTPFPTTVNTVSAQTILSDQVNALIRNPAAMKAAQDYAGLTGMTTEQVVVNEAYAIAHNYGWL